VQEQWDPDHIDEPAMHCQARTALEAAERCADDSDSNYANFIVRNNETGEYRNIELQRSWSVKTDRPTSLKELCAP
jgi:hypothetical protein